MFHYENESFWLDIIKNSEEIPLHNLATRMLLLRLKLLTKDDSFEKKQEALTILHNFFKTNEILLKEDLDCIHEYYRDKKPSLLTLEETSKLIRSGERLLVAGDEDLLSLLPQGEWIGGTIPYFMSEDGGLYSKDMLNVFILPHYITDTDIKIYTKKDIEFLGKDYKDNGASFILIPGFSEIHKYYGKDCTSWPGLFKVPLIGWITGAKLENGKVVSGPKVFNGRTGSGSAEHAVVMHTRLPEGKHAVIHTINLFNQGSGDVLKFTRTGFDVTDCLVNGVRRNFAEYLIENNIDLQIPLVASYEGTKVNVSIKSLDLDSKTVSLFGCVFENIEYRFANALGEYVEMFRKELKFHTGKPIFSCNCILNYLYAELESKKTDRFLGPFTFGEVGHILHNQTLVYLTIEDFKDKEPR